MDTQRGYEDLEVWQRAMDLVPRVYDLCEERPLRSDRGLVDQMQRAAVSVAANISEGYERGSTREWIRVLFIARGSTGELRCLLQIAERLKLLTAEQAQ